MPTIYRTTCTFVICLWTSIIPPETFHFLPLDNFGHLPPERLSFPSLAVYLLKMPTMPVVSIRAFHQRDCLVCGRERAQPNDCAIHVLLIMVFPQERICVT
ncbi:hypothetical protein TNIN_392981 [Trichonephila inaurata madagascariensis]|uniref:Uncharacterized protein n=1 Tax=Trichonephila inaurata madagascariensis TaxID=2747483 RepID=A0A8X6X3L8_9ARAC|nr:hypothetical protein TNIN_392981 [Trichonephila inaurata madagascariensis]